VLHGGTYQVETVSHLFLRDGQHLSPELSYEKSRASLSHAISNAKAVGARSIYMLTGGHGALTWEEAAECFTAAIAPCVVEAKEAGVALLVEDTGPFRAHFHIAHTLRDTITLAEMSNIGICLDVFSCWTEAGLQQSIARAVPRCGVVQLSDYVFGDGCLPGRAVPGDGAIPLKRMIGWMLQAGYRGTFDLELVGERIDKEGHVTAVRRGIEHVTAILESLGA
jgi:sugar phosphate isomerase/epimerase